MEGSGLTITQFSILRALDRNGPMPLSRLADDLVMERTSLYRTISALTGTDAVRIADGQRGRERIASLTPVGEGKIIAALPHWERTQARIIEMIGSDEWSDLSKRLVTFTDQIRNHPN